MQSKKIVVTGASRGIGYELVKQLVAAGHSVVALSRNIKPMESLSSENISVDISLAEDLAKVEQYISNNWDRVDAIIHNAGKLIHKPFAETSTQDYLEVFKVNVFAVAELTRLLMPYLKKGSHVVTVSSMGGIQGSLKFPGLAAYSSSKGAVITLTELLAEEYKEQGIQFNALALGAVQTEMLEQAFPGFEAPVTAKEMAAYIADFTLTGHQFYNGKVLQVSSSTP
ncbi:MAG: SDR family NAD(P)-dependent oxidoreductase [Flavobacteriaceae bacterium]|nr:SDR family NAD(P)-dependent oxidoreductase [Flavobacteriaceae bacterium]